MEFLPFLRVSMPSRQGRLVGGLQQHPVGRRRGGGGSYQASLPDPEAQGDRDGIQSKWNPSLKATSLAVANSGSTSNESFFYKLIPCCRSTICLRLPVLLVSYLVSKHWVAYIRFPFLSFLCLQGRNSHEIFHRHCSR